MKVLVIGGTRFVGPLLVFRLLARGDRVTLFNRGTHADPFGARVERVLGDRTRDLDRVTGNFDAVLDLAAYERPDVEGVIRTFSGRIGRYLFVSTGQVYLVRESLEAPYRERDYDGPTIARPHTEEDGPEWDYGMGKRACEDLLVAAGAGFPSTRLRIPMVNGPRDHYRRIERLVHRILDGGPLLCAEPERRVRHVDAAEVARTMVALIDDDRALGEAYNQAQDETPTIEELVSAIGREIGASVRMVKTSRDRMRASGIDPRAAFPFGGPWMSFLDPAKIRALGIGHAPLDRTIAKIVGELLAHLPEPPEDYRAQRAREIALASEAT
ncbi:MAG: NAD-dependent epimerase/dehydratase family protein [Polyangiales bacterium]